MTKFYCPDHGYRCAIPAAVSAIVVCGAPLGYGKKCKRRCVTVPLKLVAS